MCIYGYQVLYVFVCLCLLCLGFIHIGIPQKEYTFLGEVSPANVKYTTHGTEQCFEIVKYRLLLIICIIKM